MSITSHIAGVILAGGKSSRMGTDKGLISFQGKRLVEKAINALKPNVSEIFISSGNPSYKCFGLPVISDIIPGKGPIGGIYTALSMTGRGGVFVLSCDMPWINNRMVAGIIEQMKEKLPCVPSFRNDLQPLCGIYPAFLATYLKHCIDSDELKMRSILRDLPKVVVEAEKLPGFHEKCFVNLNCPADLMLNTI